jgi:hypothetical protein
VFAWSEGTLGPATLLAASAEWEDLAAEMHLAACRCESVAANQWIVDGPIVDGDDSRSPAVRRMG